jgi:cell division septation protein DedD
VALAAIIVSVVATLIALGSLRYARSADRRANRAEHRDVARLTSEQAGGQIAELERVGEIMRQVAEAVGSALDSNAPRRVHAGVARLEADQGSQG